MWQIVCVVAISIFWMNNGLDKAGGNPRYDEIVLRANHSFLEMA